MEIGLSLGSNIGDRAANMSTARDAIASLEGVRLVAQSSLYETAPVGVKEEYMHMSFLNAVVIIESETAAGPLLYLLSGIEADLGRERGEDRYAPRPIDIDILYAGNECIDSGGLTVPHPRWAERRFVVEPLAEIRPDLIIPGSSRSAREILASLNDRSGVQALAVNW
ncbi:MAG: 2-amino-4-hydroxy-6-hydroxymethyldihydropteridine diphosphokinase [Verrucomicrobia bacterium]|nr:2-amino-4-hydroxy-6-hydroxymethyldihydropteridine diphosphokinase [Verrucomicrobiota bacterium]